MKDYGSELTVVFSWIFVSLSRVTNHMTFYNSNAVIGGKFISKNPLLTSLNAVNSTNESTQIYSKSCDFIL